MSNLLDLLTHLVYGESNREDHNLPFKTVLDLNVLKRQFKRSLFYVGDE